MEPERPDSRTFQSGDFIWPKRPDQSVPYFTDPARDYDYEFEKRQWEREKKEFLDGVARKSNVPEFDQTIASQLRELSFDDFYALYVKPDLANSESMALIRTPYPGHVGIILCDTQTIWVVEAYPDHVRKVPYDQWVAEFSKADVWHGRLKNVEKAKRVLVATEAEKQKGKPYSIMSFDLSDAQKFYCSKLVWFAVFQALGFPVDDNPNPRRMLTWFSPKDLMNVQRMDLLFRPGDYKVQ